MAKNASQQSPSLADWGQRAEYYLKRYPEQFEMFMDKQVSPNARYKSINEFDICALGHQLSMFESWVAFKESNSSVADLGPLPKIALDVVTAMYSISPLLMVAGIQPIDEQSGLVWFMDWVARNTRGNVTNGDVLISPTDTPDVFPEDYASDTVLASHFVTNGSAQTYTNQGLIAAQDFTSPLDPQRVSIYGVTTFNAGADVVTWATMKVDPATGHFADAQVVNTNLYSIQGTVDFTNGDVDLRFSAVPTASSVNLYADVATLEEAGSDLQAASLQMRTKNVNSRWYAMKSTFGFFEQFTLKKRWGLSAEDIMTKNLATAMNNEIFNIVLSKLIANVPANQKVVWPRNPGTGVSLLEHTQTLPFAMTDAGARIPRYAGRGQVNCWIVGIEAGAVLETLPGMNVTFNNATLGPHVFGTFRGTPVVRVPYSDQLDPNAIIGVYKGDTPFEASVVYAPYMPLTMTDLMSTGANPLQQQKGCATAGATETMIPKFSCQVDIDQTGFDYGT